MVRKVVAMHGRCELCEREDIELTKHHLLPREEGGGPEHIAMLCVPCHKQVHGFYDNRELAVRLSSLGALKEDERIKGYLTFIRKQPSGKHTAVKKSRERRKKKR